MISILFTGDFCPIGRISQRKDHSIYNDLLPVLSDVDLKVTNLECPLCDFNKTEILKTGPNLRADKDSIASLKMGGFNLVTLANNHILDYDESGLESTIQVCKQNKIDFVGAGSNIQEARKIFYKVLGNTKIGIVNIAENEFSTADINNAGANPLELISNYKDIKEANENSDYVFVVIHGGHEGYNLPSPRMQETYRFFIDAGASAVIGHHSHCYSGYEMYHGAPIFYSLGNFIFDDKTMMSDYEWTSGYAVGFTLDFGKLEFKLYPYRQNTEKTVGVRLLTSDENAVFETNLEKINNIIADKNLLRSAFFEFVESRKNTYLSYIEPLTSNKYISYLFHNKILPGLFSNAKKRLLLNLIRCEAHRDMLMSTLEKNMKR